MPWKTSVAGLCGFATGLYLAYLFRQLPVVALLALLACTGLPMWLLEWRRNPAPVEGEDPNGGEQRIRRGWRLRGTLAALPLWALTLNVLPLAGNTAVTVTGFWSVLAACWPLLFAGMAWYVLRPTTGFPPSGLELVGRWWALWGERNAFPWAVLRDQLVKAFFLPLMITFAYSWAMQASDSPFAFSAGFYAASVALLYLVDTSFATIGYLSTSRRLDSHIRSSNPYLLGWASALACYPPFFTWLKQAGFQYRDGLLWSHWLAPGQPLFHLWGGTIVALTLVYALSTVVFGIRFSNLTHRGIITHGPYRFTKHPAYLSKNLSWWLISVPFISSAGPATAALHCAILLGVNAIYWLRAKTEERHLMHDDTYRAYAEWIARHGLFARVARVLRRA